MGLQISQTPTVINYETIPASFKHQTQNAKLELSYRKLQLNQRTELPKVLIDQSQCFSESGIKSSSEFWSEAAQLGKQQAMEYIAKAVDEGNFMADIYGGSPNAIAQISANNFIEMREFGMVTMPRSRPKIEVTGSLTLEPNVNGLGVLNGVDGTYTPGRVNFEFSPGKVNFYVKQYGKVNIEYVGNNVDKYL